MRRWIALGVAVVGVAWGPYLYTELAHRSAGNADAAAASESKLMAATDTVPDVPVAEPAPAAQPPSQPVPAAEPAPSPTIAPEHDNSIQPASAELPAPNAPLGAAAAAMAGPSGSVQQPDQAASAPRPGSTAEQPAPNAPTRATAEASTPKNTPSAVVGAAPSNTADPERDKPEAHRAQEPTRTPEERTRAYHNTFETEPRDGTWADEQEPSIRQLTAAVGLGSEDVTEVVCRRSVCKLTFKSAQLPEDVAAALQARIKTEYGDTMLETHDPQSARPAQLYILRSGYNLDPPKPD